MLACQLICWVAFLPWFRWRLTVALYIDAGISDIIILGFRFSGGIGELKSQSDYAFYEALDQVKANSSSLWPLQAYEEELDSVIVVNVPDHQTGKYSFKFEEITGTAAWTSFYDLNVSGYNFDFEIDPTDLNLAEFPIFLLVDRGVKFSQNAFTGNLLVFPTTFYGCTSSAKVEISYNMLRDPLSDEIGNGNNDTIINAWPVFPAINFIDSLLIKENRNISSSNATAPIFPYLRGVMQSAWVQQSDQSAVENEAM